MAANPVNKKVVVTGGSSGIGKAVATQFARAGANVMIVARNAERLEEAAQEIAANSGATRDGAAGGGSVTVGIVDVAQGAEGIAEVVGDDVDILVCSAGVSHPAVFEEATQREWEQTMSVNVMGCVHSVNAVLAGMKRRRRGQIVFLSSMAGQVGIYGLASYCASKFALRGMAEALRMECEPYGITISMVYPPDTDTPMLAKENEMKPLECKLISEGAGLWSAEDVAAGIVQGMRSPAFMLGVGLDGWMLNHLTVGMLPSPTVLHLVTGVLLAPLFRIIAVCHSVPWDWLVAREHRKKQSGSSSDGSTAAFLEK